MSIVKIKLYSIFSFGTLLIAFILLGVLVFWTWWPYKIITFSDAYYQTTAMTYTQGQTGTYIVKYCKYSSPPVTKTKEFVDQVVYQASGNVPTTLPTGCHTAIVPFTIPEELPNGHYRLLIDAKYQVNPIRIITSIRETNYFTVI